MVPTDAAEYGVVVPISAARSAAPAAGDAEVSVADPLRLAGLLAQATQLALGAKLAQTALHDVFALATGHGCGDWVGVSHLTVEGDVLTPAANNELVRIADHLQGDYAEGPAVDAAGRNETVTCADLATSSRWPRWAPRVAALGAGSLTCLPLHAGRRSLGALTMYRQQPHPYTRQDLQIAELIASHVELVLENLAVCDNASAAADARHRIGKAQGVLIQQFGMDHEQASALLRRYSQDTNRKIGDIAADVTATRGLPAQRPPTP